MTDAFGLTRLFIAPPPRAADPRLAQDWVGGVMTYWDATSHANTVVVGGAVIYQNLPVVSPIGLTPGKVLLAKSPSGYIVLGMLTSAAGALLDPIRYRVLRADVPAADSTLIDAGLLTFQLNPDTQYGLDGSLFYNANSGADIKFAWTGPPNMVTKWAMFGTEDAAATHVFFEVMTAYGDAATQRLYGWGFSAPAQPQGWFATTDTGGILQLRFAQGTNNATPALLQQGSWLRLTELAASSGTETYVKQYTCTASRSYNDSGNPIGSPDQDNNIYAGDFPDRPHGNERSMLIFPGSTMRADLTGATILSARLFLYCFKAEETNGSLVEPRTEPNTSVPATYSPTASSPDTSLHDAWPVPGWFSVECFYKGGSASLLNGILAGDNAVGLPPILFGWAATGYRGYGFGVNTRPYFEVTYAL